MNQEVKTEIALYESTLGSKFVVCSLLLVIALCFALKRLNVVVNKECTQ